MKQTMMTMLRDLTEAPGVPGQERAVRSVMRRYLEPFGTIVVDNLGGIACRVAGREDGPKIMIAAHMDEVGFLVTKITDKGFLRFQPLGGWFDQVLLAQRVQVVTRSGTLLGVIGSKPPHLIPPERRDKVVKVKDMFIDIGASSRDEAMTWGVRPGDMIVPATSCTPMHNEKILLAKACDNRIGCALVLEVVQRLQDEEHPNVVYGAATVQEEVGLRGAGPLTQVIDPAIGLIVESGPATDTPDAGGDEMVVRITEGPVLSLYDRTMIPHTGLRDVVIDCAEQAGIAVQFRVGSGGTDGGRVHVHGVGVPSLVVSVPTRYIHSHNALLHLDDVEQTAQLLVAVIKKLDAEVVAQLRA